MCHLTEGFKFCTCNVNSGHSKKNIIDKIKRITKKGIDFPEQSTEPFTWYLYHRKKLNYLDGLIEFGDSDNKKVDQKLILDKLAHQNLFDFDYAPENNDLLVVILPQYTVEFIFQHNEWTKKDEIIHMDLAEHFEIANGKIITT